MTAPHSTSPDDDTKPKIDLSVTQVAATALAAVTSAVLGSVFGAAGTLIGAAVASVIYTVASAVYRSSLERSRAKFRSFVRRLWPFPASQEGSRTERSDPATATAPPGDERPTGERPGDERPGDSTDRGPQPEDRSGRFAALRWGAMVGAAIGGFVLAMGVITGFEQVRGETLSGNEGTTLGRVVTDPSGPREPEAPPTPPSSSVPPSATPTATTEPSSTAPETTTPDGDPSAEQSPSETSGTPTPTAPPPLIPPLAPRAGG